MIDIENLMKRINFYMNHQKQVPPTVNNAEQALEIEKMRKAVSDLCEGKRKISPEFQKDAFDVVCFEFAKQILKDQRR